MEKIFAYLTSARFLSSVVIAALALAIGTILKRTAARYLDKEGEKLRQGSRRGTYLRVFTGIIYLALLLLAAVLILQIHGVNVTSLVTGLGIAGIVVGLALQDVLKDVIMGLNILSGDFFVVGDVVQYGAVKGEVVEFTLKATKLRELTTNNILTVSNRNISEVSKISREIFLPVPTGYDEDPAQIEQVLAELAAEIRQLPDVEDCVCLGLTELADSSVNYLLRISASPLVHTAVRRRALGVIRHGFARRGISIPYPQVDVHTRA